MEKQALKESLSKLHSELEATDSLDPELAELVNRLDDDLHRLMQGQKDDLPESFAERVDQIAVEFAARHPQLEPILREIGDTLARLGI